MEQGIAPRGRPLLVLGSPAGLPEAGQPKPTIASGAVRNDGHGHAYGHGENESWYVTLSAPRTMV